jgi:hypothetical protein
MLATIQSKTFLSFRLLSKKHKNWNIQKYIFAWVVPRRPVFAPGQHVGFVVGKVTLEQVFSEYLGFSCLSFHKFLHLHNYPGLAQKASLWPQCPVVPIGLHSPQYQLKEYFCLWFCFILRIQTLSTKMIFLFSHCISSNAIVWR